MIERIIDWSAKNRFVVILIYVLITGFGIYAVIKLPVDAIPDLSENQVIVFTEWMGRSPEIVEQQVTYPISSALQGLPEVKALFQKTNNVSSSEYPEQRKTFTFLLIFKSSSQAIFPSIVGIE